jgi:hypothetical protein
VAHTISSAGRIFWFYRSSVGHTKFHGRCSEAKTSVAAAVAESVAGRDLWVNMTASFKDALEKYWAFIQRDAGYGRIGDAKVGRFCRAAAAFKMFTVLPNSADPERVFSELRRMITPSRTNLANVQSSGMLFMPPIIGPSSERR